MCQPPNVCCMSLACRGHTTLTCCSWSMHVCLSGVFWSPSEDDAILSSPLLSSLFPRSFLALLCSSSSSLVSVLCIGKIPNRDTCSLRVFQAQPEHAPLPPFFHPSETTSKSSFHTLQSRPCAHFTQLIHIILFSQFASSPISRFALKPLANHPDKNNKSTCSCSCSVFHLPNHNFSFLSLFLRPRLGHGQCFVLS